MIALVPTRYHQNTGWVFHKNLIVSDVLCARVAFSFTMGLCPTASLSLSTHGTTTITTVGKQHYACLLCSAVAAINTFTVVDYANEFLVLLLMMMYCISCKKDWAWVDEASRLTYRLVHF